MFKVTATRISNMAGLKASFYPQSEMPYSDASGLGNVHDGTVGYKASSRTLPREHSIHTNTPYTPTQFTTKMAQGNHYCLTNASVYELEERTGF
jgi:hypothetical protein